MVSSNSIALILHLLSDHSILVPVPIIRALIIPVRHDPHIVVLVHVHVAQIRPVFIVIDVECTSLAAYPLFALLPHVFLSSAFSDPPVNISLTDILRCWGQKPPTMMPTDCSVLRTPTILPNIRISWDIYPTFMLISGRVPRSFTHL